MKKAKFRGSKLDSFEEDWLDNQSHSKRGTRKPPLKASAPELLSPTLANGRVIEVFPKLCHVLLLNEGDTLLCSYKRAGVFQNAKGQVRERSPVAVGDLVVVKRLGQKDGVIEGVCERRNFFLRSAPGRSEQVTHAIAANLDRLIIVSSAVDPGFSPGLIDRFLISAKKGGVDPILVINKMDRWDPNETLKPWTYYAENLKIPVFEVSAQHEMGLNELRAEILGKSVVFIGHSGVGKTTLLRRLLGKEIGKTGQVNDHTGKGRHTTSSSTLYVHSDHSHWIDTPGVRSFGISDLAQEDLKNFFEEFQQVRCEAPNCDHLEEGGCGVRDLPRYSSYLQIYQSLEENFQE